MKSDIKERCEKFGIMTDTDDRWEKGIEHHPESEKLFVELREVDYELNHDVFCWKAGGDGNNGEELMYELDIIFELRDAEAKAAKGG